MPSDITGTEIIAKIRQTGKRRLEFLPGPVFANLILADEINRTPPKTQAAMLQTMQEREVTVGTKTYPLPAPFHVFATQNPIEMEGTYVLPRRRPIVSCSASIARIRPTRRRDGWCAIRPGWSRRKGHRS